MSRTTGCALLFAAVLLAWGVLSFHERPADASQAGRQPFGNAVEQRNAIIKELREIKALLKEQNTLLRAPAKKPSKKP